MPYYCVWQRDLVSCSHQLRPWNPVCTSSTKTLYTVCPHVLEHCQGLNFKFIIVFWEWGFLFIIYQVNRVLNSTFKIALYLIILNKWTMTFIFLKFCIKQQVCALDRIVWINHSTLYYYNNLLEKNYTEECFMGKWKFNYPAILLFFILYPIFLIFW